MRASRWPPSALAGSLTAGERFMTGRNCRHRSPRSTSWCSSCDGILACDSTLHLDSISMEPISAYRHAKQGWLWSRWSAMSSQFAQRRIAGGVFRQR